MLADCLASHCEDGAGLEAHRQGRSIVTEVAKELREILPGRLRGSLASERAFW